MDSETTPLLQSQSNLKQEQEQELGNRKCWCCWESSPETELIRVCSGCKDPDLQFIHQDCMDRYITNLPSPRRQRQTEQGLLEGATEPIQLEDGPDRQFYCTRCKDPYRIESRRVSSFYILTQEKVLLPSMVLITVCILILTVSCLGLIIDHFSTGTVVYFLRIPVWMLATFMLAVSHLVNGFTWIMVLRYCSGRFTRHVLPIETPPSS